MATIDTNMSLVMIDPNEPLELYDGTIIKGRLEWFLYALCCLDYGNLPTPLSRIEEWANALITNELPNMEPQSRAEEFFKAILTGDTSNLPTPQSRSEVLLDKLARGEYDFTNVEKIQSRYEFLLAYLIKNGGGIGNIDYVLYKFQKEDETLYNTKERPVKSAILKGQTLVNLVTNPRMLINANDEVTLGDNKISITKSASGISYILFDFLSKPSTEYTIILNFTKFSQQASYYGVYIDGVYGDINSEPFNTGSLGIIKRKFTSKDTVEGLLSIGIHSDIPTGTEIEFNDIMVLEGDYTNIDVPYFTGMQSVKMPVLKTTGKNLADINNSTTNNVDKIYIPCYLVKGNNYTITTNVDYSGRLISIQTINDEEVQIISDWGVNNKQFTFNGETGKYLILIWRGSLISEYPNIQVQLEQGTQATPYEPFKSNILSTSDDVTLRGIGDVKDTLDCLTGEVTERIGEIVLDGSDDETITMWFNKENNAYFGIGKINNVYKPRYEKICTVCDKLPTPDVNPKQFEEGDYEGVSVWDNNLPIIIGINKNRLQDTTVSAFRQWLQQNPIKIQYQLGTPVVKTVDLTITDQGGATIPKLNTFDKITHVNVSATDILPGVEMEVATTIGEDLSGTLYSTMEDIETKQEALKESNNAQTESVNSTMMAATEIYESLL